MSTDDEIPIVRTNEDLAGMIMELRQLGMPDEDIHHVFNFLIGGEEYGDVPGNDG